jgi:hypothetical protein
VCGAAEGEKRKQRDGVILVGGWSNLGSWILMCLGDLDGLKK